MIGLRFFSLKSADARGAGTRDEPLKTSAWEATLNDVNFVCLLPVGMALGDKISLSFPELYNRVYRIYSINRPGCLLNFWTLRVGAFSRWALIRGWALIKFSPFSAIVVSLFCNKTQRCNKARFL